MNRRIFFVVGVVVLFFAGLLLFRTREKADSSAVAVEEVVVEAAVVDEGKKIYAQAKSLITENRLNEAKGALTKIIEEYPNTEVISDVQRDLWELNIGILFSPLKTEDSIFYEVKPGDMLVKIAKRHGTTVEFIMKSNDLKSADIRPFMKLKISTAKYSVIVDKSQNTLILKAGEEVLKIYKVSTGKNNSTPVGVFKITNDKLKDPVWYKTGAVVAPNSPDNQLGSRWMGLSKEGYGIHGTNDPSTVGQYITNGCVRMYEEDVQELYAILPVGTEVMIVE